MGLLELISGLKAPDQDLKGLGNVQIDGQTDRCKDLNSPLFPTGHRPFRAAAQKAIFSCNFYAVTLEAILPKWTI